MSSTFNPDLTLGVLEVGVLISTFLFGLATLQAWTYYQSFPGDQWMLKALAGGSCMVFYQIFELGHTICDSHAIYTMTVTDYGNPEKLVSVPASVTITVLFTAFIVTLVQAFYAFRIRTLTGNLYIALFCWAATGAQFIISIILTVIAFQTRNEAAYEVRAGLKIPAALILAALVDIIVAITLTYYFVVQRNSALRRSAKLLDQLIILTIQTGVLTSIAAVATVITFQTMKHNFVWLGLFVLLASLYANSLFALLNARVVFRRNNASGGAVIGLDNVRDTSSGGGGSKLNTFSFERPHFGEADDEESPPGGVQNPVKLDSMIHVKTHVERISDYDGLGKV